MAKINGVELKNLHGFTGHEGYCYQGNVYLNGKKLGFWSQDSWGGSDDFDFDVSVLSKACADYKDGFPDDYKYKEFCDIESLMYALTCIKETEKHCKKSFKSGAKAVYYMTDGYHVSWLSLDEVMTPDEVRKTYPRQTAQMEAEMFKSGYREQILTPNDFDIIIDKNHPAPALLMD